MSVLADLYDVAVSRKNSPEAGSYTCYLFEKGLDKILKKCGEECSEMLIAAKNCEAGQGSGELKNEIADLLYHITVLCAERELPWSDIESELEARRAKIGNLKNMKTVDKLT